MANEHYIQPIFQPLRVVYKVFGIPAMTLLGIVGVCAVGFVIAFMLGNVTTPVERELTSAETAAYVREYQADQEILQQVEAEREALGVQGYAALSLTEDEQAALDRCAKIGIFTDSTEAELAALAPTTLVEEQEVFPRFWRYLILIGGPAIIGAALFMEINRTSAYREIKRRIAFNRSQKNYRNLPMSFVERETGKGYWDAIISDGSEGQEQ